MNKKTSSLFCSMLLVTCLIAQSGLKAEYFDGTQFNREVSTRIDANIDMSWNDTPPVPGIDPHDCSIRWTGILRSPESGIFTFSAKVDDGIRVWVGGVFVIDAWDLHDDGKFSGTVRMEKGVQYDLKVEYFNALVEGEIRLLWELPVSKDKIGKPAPEAKVIESKYLFQTIQKPAHVTPPKPVAETKKPATSSKSKPKPKANKPVSATLPIAQNAPVHVDTLEKYLPKNILFEQGKSIILPESYDELDRLASFLGRNAHLRLTVEGHTDVIGDRNKNMILSQQRADAVRQYLSNDGIEANRIEAKGYGSTRPLVNDRLKEGVSVNRRVAFIIR